MNPTNFEKAHFRRAKVTTPKRKDEARQTEAELYSQIKIII
jgi:hypothetical protein